MACPASSPESASGSTSTPVSGSDKSRVTGTVKEGIVGGRRRPTDCEKAGRSHEKRRGGAGLWAGEAAKGEEAGSGEAALGEGEAFFPNSMCIAGN
mmetsp:Transcript_16178/g.38787  ORF Transcript_16178/g.38787 Transcript_16178/m.38787 type:complete len:96 (-) Transcript_16178:3222-3509(-)